MKILSFHPCFTGDRNLICQGRPPGRTEEEAVSRADLVVLPQGCSRELHTLVQQSGKPCFPDYTIRFAYPGKVGQTRFFSDFDIPHPQTRAFPSLAAWEASGVGDPFAWLGDPFVFKFDWGGEGAAVHLVRQQADFYRLLDSARQNEKNGMAGFLLQAFIPPGHPSLRVVVIGRHRAAYWRVQKNPEGFRANLSRGATIDRKIYPLQREAGLELTRALCHRAGIDLAGFDYLFPRQADGGLTLTPLALEINWFFGRSGLGGTTAYLQLLEREIRGWIQRQHSDEPEKTP